jgi:cell division topological specificity factor
MKLEGITMFDNFKKTFKKVVKQEQPEELESKSAAKERLQLVLMQDRANVSSEFLELMKNEIIDVVKKYVIIDEDTIDVRLTTKVNEDGTNGEPTLYANIPILNIRNELKADKMPNQLEITDLIKEQEENEEKDESQEKQQLFNMSDTNRTVILDDETLSKINKELVLTKEKEAKQEEKQAKQEAKQAKREARHTGSIPIIKSKEEKNSVKEEPKKEIKEEASKTLKKSIEEEMAELDDLEKELQNAVKSEQTEDNDDSEDDDFVTFDELYEKATREDEMLEKEKAKKNKSNDKKGK